jgi:hypothetical protein
MVKRAKTDRDAHFQTALYEEVSFVADSSRMKVMAHHHLNVSCVFGPFQSYGPQPFIFGI